MLAFYDCVSNWAEIARHVSDAEFQRVLNDGFSKFTLGRWGEPFPAPGREYPADWEDFGGDLRTEDDGPWLGAEGPYRLYVKNLACFFLVNANLRLAQLILPDRDWRIVVSPFHATVWDGRDLLWDMTGLALYGQADLAFEFAFGMGKQLPVGEYFHVKFAEPAKAPTIQPYRRYA